MSAIYSFLQKRKLHESQHGFIMIFIAYVISAILLILGSDMFYNITSAAAGIGVQTEEETQKVFNTELYTSQTNDLPSITRLMNPYGFSAVEQVSEQDQISEADSGSSDTVWFLGNSMDEETFDSVSQKLGSSTDKKPKESKDTVVKSQSAEIGAYAGITDEEVGMLERIVQAEAGGEDMVGKILIVNVIMNRVESKRFPDSIKGVIFQQKGGEYQFSPVGDKRYWSVNISDSTQEAVKRALRGEDYSKGALYFVARRRTDTSSMAWFDNKLDRLFKHGGHEFYKNK